LRARFLEIVAPEFEEGEVVPAGDDIVAEDTFEVDKAPAVDVEEDVSGLPTRPDELKARVV
jgi:hypothetical protein